MQYTKIGTWYKLGRGGTSCTCVDGVVRSDLLNFKGVGGGGGGGGVRQGSPPVAVVDMPYVDMPYAWYWCPRSFCRSFRGTGQALLVLVFVRRWACLRRTSCLRAILDASTSTSRGVKTTSHSLRHKGCLGCIRHAVGCKASECICGLQTRSICRVAPGTASRD